MQKLKNLYKNISAIFSFIFTKDGRQKVLAVFLENKYDYGVVLSDIGCIKILLKEKETDK